MPTPLMQDTAPLVQAIPELESELPAEMFLQSDAFVLLAWGVVALVVVAVVVALWWVRRSRRALPPAPSPLEMALAHLSEVEQSLPPLRECGLQVSMILRQYLQGAVQDPALYETHEEFSRRLDALATVPEECRYDTRYLLDRLADLKYAGAREQDPVQARTLIEQARALLLRIQEVQQQNARAARVSAEPSSPTRASS